MLRKTIFILCLIVLTHVQGQNLVQNPGFENRKHCPTGINQSSLSLVNKWHQASKGTSDYFNACSQKVGVPNNTFGEEKAKDGNSYIGLISFSPSKRNYREYMQSKLIKPLEKDQLYCVEFYTSLADNAQFLIDGLGIHFSKNKVKTQNDKLIPVQAQINNPSLNYLDNTKGWTLLSDVYTAAGNENYITIGNFHRDRDLKIRQRNVKDLKNLNHDYAYYYIDQLSVRPIETKKECSCTFELARKEIEERPAFEENSYKNISIETVLFDFDETVISREEQMRLNDVINLMKVNPYIMLEVIGHTDVIGDKNYNKNLSEQRASAVMQFLKDRGIAEDRIKMNYFGSSKPIASNRTNEGRSKNRRVEFLVIEKAYTDYQY
ncbi:MAG: OmpA family protein [Bacteroidota bacterium]